MKKITQSELDDVLYLHRKWLKTSRGKPLVLRNSDLSSLNFAGQDLSFAIFDSSNLSESNLSDTILYETVLSGANLANADMRRANLNNCFVIRSNFREANLESAIMDYVYINDNKLNNVEFFADVVVLKTAEWIAHIRKDSIRIGCQIHSFDKWMAFTDNDIDSIDKKASSTWKNSNLSFVSTI